MSVITGSNLSRRFGPLDVFQGVNIRVEKGDRIGLVGPNGEGKTTLLRILAGLDAPTDGVVTRMRGMTIGYLPQDPPPAGDRTLWDDVSAQFAGLMRRADELRRLEEQMADPLAYEQALAEYGPLQAAFEAAGGYDWELRVRQVLTGLGFPPAEHHLPLAYLSGGQRTRGLLARLLLQEPDLLLMDEPTNHLDLQATEWLESVLLQWRGSMVVVSHDRYFLDRVANRIWELANQRLDAYRGNYSHFSLQRTMRRERQLEEWKRQQQYIAKEQEYIRRNIAGQNTRQAQGRRTRLERMAAEDGLVERPEERQAIRLNLDARLRSGNLVMRTRDLVVGYRSSNGNQPRREDVSGGYEYVARHSGPTPDDNVLFRSEDIELLRGQRVALIGPNGAGKSTFLKTVLGQLQPLGGRLRIGASVHIGYLAQAHDMLVPEKTILDTILDASPRMEIGQARSFLGRFLFSGDDAYKTIEVLSGGQRSRVALALLTLQGANFLLLDEPTNHLDIDSQEVLEDMLKAFGGTVLLVTHDRYLVDAVATQVWALDAQRGEMRAYEGNYSAYLAAKAAEEETASESQVDDSALSDARLHRERSREERRQRKVVEQRQAEADRLEELIHSMERRLETLGEQIAAASQAQELERVRALGVEYQAVADRLHQLMEEWTEFAL
ncbi:MAG: ABC-F family ATP-binding cassette domain-containing protein [Anaerolineales bacterium]|nr:ABC-F family ATP-binding cassette domain-containing protein [Anaerolineales bacterium]